MNEPFFKKINWEKIQKKEEKPPIKPKLINSMKVSKADILSMQDEIQVTPKAGSNYLSVGVD